MIEIDEVDYLFRKVRRYSVFLSLSGSIVFFLTLIQMAIILVVLSDITGFYVNIYIRYAHIAIFILIVCIVYIRDVLLNEGNASFQLLSDAMESKSTYDESNQYYRDKYLGEGFQTHVRLTLRSFVANRRLPLLRGSDSGEFFYLIVNLFLAVAGIGVGYLNLGGVRPFN